MRFKEKKACLRVENLNLIKFFLTDLSFFLRSLNLKQYTGTVAIQKYYIKKHWIFSYLDSTNWRTRSGSMYSTTNYVDPKPCSIVLQPPNTTVSNFSPYTEARQKRCKSEKHMPSTRSTLSLYWGDANILTSRSMLTTPVERRLGFFFLEMASWVPSGLSPSRERERQQCSETELQKNKSILC